MRRVMLVWLVALVAGCAGSNNYLAWQVNYAKSIPDPMARSSAMAAVARSGAYVGDLDTVTAALRDLRDDPRHDEIAAECAIHLAQNGQANDGRRVAKRIIEPTKRKELLARIDEEFGEVEKKPQ